MSQPLSGGDINTLSISDFRNSNVWVFLPFDSCILKTVREERVGILHKENFIRSINVPRTKITKTSIWRHLIGNGEECTESQIMIIVLRYHTATFFGHHT